MLPSLLPPTHQAQLLRVAALPGSPLQPRGLWSADPRALERSVGARVRPLPPGRAARVRHRQRDPAQHGAAVAAERAQALGRVDRLAHLLHLHGGACLCLATASAVSTHTLTSRCCSCSRSCSRSTTARAGSTAGRSVPRESGVSRSTCSKPTCSTTRTRGARLPRSARTRSSRL